MFQEGKLNLNRDINDIRPLLKIPGNKFRLSREEIKKVVDKLAEENKLLAKLLDSTFCDETLDISQYISFTNKKFLNYDNEILREIERILPSLDPDAFACVKDFFANYSHLTNRQRWIAKYIFDKFEHNAQ